MLTMITTEFFEVGRVPKQVRRDLTIGSTTSDIRRLKELRDGVEEHGDSYFDTHGAKRLFRSVAGFSADNVYDPGIITGTRRGGYRDVRDTSDMYRFMCVLEQDNSSLRSSTRLRILVSGFTDRAQLDRDGMPDPETIMHINSITTLRVQNEGGLSARETYKIVDNAMVVLPNRRDRNSEKFSSPSLLTSYADTFDDGHEDVHTEMVVDEDGNRARAVRHNVSSPDKYFGVLARSDFAATNDQRANEGVLENDHWQTRPLGLGTYTSFHLKNNNVDYSILKNKFYEAFVDASSEHSDDVGSGMYMDNAFALKDLLEACNIRESRMVDYISVKPFANLDYDSERWESAHGESMGAYDICHRIPELMLNNLILGCSFTVSNREVGLRSGRVEAEFSFLGDVNDRGRGSYNIVPITGTGDLPSYFVDNFEQKIIDEVFNPLSDYGAEQLSITVYSTLSGLTRVEIGYGGDREEPYTFASFCESRLINSLTRQNDIGFKRLTEGYSSLRGEIRTGSLFRAGRKFDEEWIKDDGPESRGNTASRGKFLGFDSSREESNKRTGLGLGLGGKRRS